MMSSRTAELQLLGLGIGVVVFSVSLFTPSGAAQQAPDPDVDRYLECADALLVQAKVAFEDAASKKALQGLTEAGDRLEEAGIRYLVLREIGPAERKKAAVDRLRSVKELDHKIQDARVALGGARGEPAPGSQLESPLGRIRRLHLTGGAPQEAARRVPVPEGKKQQEAEVIPDKNVIFFGARAGTFQLTKAVVGPPID